MATSKKSKQETQTPVAEVAEVAEVAPLGATSLAEIAAAGTDGTYAHASVYGPLVEAGHVEVNTSIVDEHGNVAVRATPEGIKVMSATDNTQPVAPSMQTAKPRPVFTLENDIQIPEGRTIGRKPETYPFDAMQVGQSFFIAATEERPEPARQLASTVTSANNRYAEEVAGETRVNRKGKTVPQTKLTRQFVIKKVDGGARIWRTV